MPDEAISAPSAETTHADPSPAPVNHQEVLNNLTTEQRSAWRLTGKLPEQPSKEESAPSASEVEKTESAPAPEAGKPQERPKRDNAETRLKELLADLKQAGLSPAELKTFKREAQKVETQAAPSPAPKKVEEPALEAPKKPDIKDPKYQGEDGWEKYEADKDKYYEDLTDFKKKEAIAEFQRNTQQEYQRQVINKEFAEARTRYKDFDQIATPVIDALKQDPQSPVFETVGRSPVFADLVYVIGEKEADREEFLQLAKADPWAASRKAMLIEQLILDEHSKKRDTKAEEKSRDEKGQFLPEKKVTGAPKPPSEVGGVAAVPGDKVAESVQKRDFASYRDEMNRREMTARRG